MFESLRSVPDTEVLSSIDSIIVQDRSLTLRLLVHLHEIERRKLYLKRGYSSMFVYCTSHLRLSEPAAARRIRTSRALARFPQLYALLESGEVNLSTVSMVAKFLKPDNADSVLTRIRGKSRRETERVVVELEPRAVMPPDRVRIVVVPVARAFLTAASPRVTVAGDSEKAPTVESKASVNDEPAIVASAAQVERRALIQFTAGENFLGLVEQVRSLASHRLPPDASFEQVFAHVMHRYVAAQDPMARHERREARGASVKRPAAAHSSRRIPTPVRDQVFTRDDGRCTYVGASGKRCDSARLLQIDHIHPVARGGRATPDNLRLLCAQHNRLEAERLGLQRMT